jgi:hypothetical protein
MHLARRIQTALIAAFCVFSLVGCGTVTGLKDKTMAGVGKVTDLAKSPFKPGVPVVEAREDDWKELPSGRDRAMAYQRERRFWLFGPPADFEEPELPELADESANSLLLLPPKSR